MAVDKCWRSVDRRWLVDQLVDEPGVAFRVWDAEGLPVGEAASLAALGDLLGRLGVAEADLVSVPPDDPWCE